MAVDFDPAQAASELAEIWNIEKDIKDQAGIKGKDWLEDRLRELLARVKNAADQLGPSGITVTIGFPLGASVSLSWERTNH